MNVIIDPAKAVKLLEEAIKLDPEDASAYEELISHAKDDNLRYEHYTLSHYHTITLSHKNKTKTRKRPLDFVVNQSHRIF
jgi:hypothetical protein